MLMKYAILLKPPKSCKNQFGSALFDCSFPFLKVHKINVSLGCVMFLMWIIQFLDTLIYFIHYELQKKP